MLSTREGERLSKTSLAPDSFANARFCALVMPRTVTPVAAAICVVMLPTEEEAPFTMRSLVDVGGGERDG
jgi:hypothetical protein